MKKALVTGGLGFIGSQIAKSLLEQKVVDKVVCFDNFGGYINFTSKNFLDYRKEQKVVQSSVFRKYSWMKIYYSI